MELEVEFIFYTGFFDMEWPWITDEMDTNGCHSQTGDLPGDLDPTQITGDYWK